MWRETFLDHPRSVGETYLEHQRQAFWYAGELLKASLACAVHALIPRLFVRTASGKVMRLHEHMTRRAPLAESGLGPLMHGAVE